MKNRKKTIFRFLAMGVLFISMNLFYSCSQEVKEPSVYNQKEYTEIVAHIDSISGLYISHVGNVNPTRSIFSRLWKAVCADVRAISHWNDTHYFDGMEIPIQSTASASKKAYQNILIHVPTYSEYNADQQADFNRLAKSYKPDFRNPTISQLHNTVILQMIKDDQWQDESTFATVEKMTKIMERLKLYTSSKDISVISRFVDEFMETLKEDDIYPNLPPEGMPSYCEDIKRYLIDRYFYTVQRLVSKEDIFDFTEKYANTIEIEDNLSDSDKKLLIDMVRLAAASFDLWNTLYNL